MYVLGISCFYHDAAAALLKDGMLVAAAEEERFSRKKHDYGFPTAAIQFCLEQAGITSRDLDYAVFYERPFVKFDRILMTVLGTFPRSWRVFRESMVAWFKDKLWIKRLIQTHLDLPPQKILFVDHHGLPLGVGGADPGPCTGAQQGSLTPPSDRCIRTTCR